MRHSGGQPGAGPSLPLQAQQNTGITAVPAVQECSIVASRGGATVLQADNKPISSVHSSDLVVAYQYTPARKPMDD